MSSLALARLGSLSRVVSCTAAAANGPPGGGGAPQQQTLRDAGAGHRWPGARPGPSADRAKTEGTGRQLVAVGQMTAVGDKQENFDTCERLAKEASAAGCLVLFLPECFSFLGSSWTESLDAAEPLDGPTMRRYQQLARDTKLWLSLGGFQQVNSDDPSKLLNTHVMVDDKGSIVKQYAKVHLFNVDVPNGPVLMESKFTSPGNQLAVCDSPVGRIGLTVCYDLRFPEMYQKLVHDHGATILTVPSAFTKPTGEAHWEVLLRARAIETQSYMIAAAQAGWHNEKRQSYGHSLIVDPWGSIVACLDDPLETGIAVAEIDAVNMQQIRTRMPVREHRQAGMAALSTNTEGSK